MTDSNFEKRLSEKLRGYGEQPPPDMFSRIEKTLAEKGAVAPVPAVRRRSLISRITITVAAAAVTGIAVVGVLRVAAPGEADIAAELRNKRDIEKIDIAKLITNELRRADKPQNVAETIIDVIREDQGLPRLNLLEALSTDSGLPGAGAEINGTQRLAMPLPNLTVPSYANMRDESTEAAKRRQQLERERAIEDYWAELFREEMTQQERRRSKNPLSTSFYAGNFGTGTGNMVYNDASAIAASGMMIDNTSMSIPESNVYEGNRPNMSPALRQDNPAYSLKHNMPITAGISVAYPVSPRLSILSGINYTYLYSLSEQTIGSSSASGTGKVYRKQHYVGIPLGVSYSIYKNRVLDIYAKAGGMLEKAVYVSESQELITANSSDETGGRRRVKGVQPSVDAGVGANIRIVNGFGIYVEPGVAYYFENPSQPKSYRTENPTNFTLRVGFRFDIK